MFLTNIATPFIVDSINGQATKKLSWGVNLKITLNNQNIAISYFLLNIVFDKMNIMLCLF